MDKTPYTVARTYRHLREHVARIIRDFYGKNHDFNDIHWALLPPFAIRTCIQDPLRERAKPETKLVA